MSSISWGLRAQLPWDTQGLRSHQRPKSDASGMCWAPLCQTDSSGGLRILSPGPMGSHHPCN
jgi:hypothetical protein